MHYTGTIWRPPYEADSLLLEVTAGCTHHKCKFCTLYSNLPIMQRRMLDEMVELMVEVLAVNRKVLRIGGTDYPYQLVKNRFLCIGQDHVEYVLHCLEQTASRIGNIKAYILTSLFNATATMDTYYTMAVQHDMVMEE